MEREFKALSATSPSSGGYLIPEIYLDEIIEMLYAKTVIFELGARKVPMTNGNLNIPKMTSGARATWGGEQRKIAKTQPAFGNVKLSAKRLEAIVPQTRELLMSTNYSADAIFAQDLTRRMELGLDWGGLFGKGGEFQPLGVKNTPGIMTIDAANLSNADLADSNGKLTADFPVYVRSAVLAKNVDDLGLGWAFNSMMEGFLMNLKTTTGVYIYREEMNGGKLLGFPYKVSNQIPTDSNNKTGLFFGNWADLLIGEQLGLETYTTLDGSWTDEDGVQHNAFEENLTATRALMYVDIAARHPESFAHIKNCVIA
jgi:HK97 family phage major capsid protein